MIIYYKIILPENEFSHLKGVNNQPYLDIRTSASHLTKTFLFSCISLFFLLKYIFYIHPISHFRAVFCLCQNESKCKTIHMICTYRTHFQTDLFWNRDTRIHLSMSCSQEPLMCFLHHRHNHNHATHSSVYLSYIPV